MLRLEVDNSCVCCDAARAPPLGEALDVDGAGPGVVGLDMFGGSRCCGRCGIEGLGAFSAAIACMSSCCCRS